MAWWSVYNVSGNGISRVDARRHTTLQVVAGVAIASLNTYFVTSPKNPPMVSIIPYVGDEKRKPTMVFLVQYIF